MTRPLVVITGAAGVIGEVLRARLGDTYRLRLLDRRPMPDASALRVDLRDRDALEAAFEGADAVVHLAAESSPEAGWDVILESNIIGTQHVLESARLARVPRVVLASSNRVVGMYERDWAPGIYDGDPSPLLDERVPPRPDSLYGVSKGFAELLGRYYAEAHGLRVVCLRIGTVLESDDPTGARPVRAAAWPPGLWERRLRSTWLSHRDCTTLVRCALSADVRFAIAYGVSDVPGRFWDIDGARTLLGYVPADRFPDGPLADDPRTAGSSEPQGAQGRPAAEPGERRLILVRPDRGGGGALAASRVHEALPPAAIVRHADEDR